MENSCLQRLRGFIDQGDFKGAVAEGQRVLALSPQSPPGDEALFGLGLVHLHYANPGKDHKKALGYLARLEQEFPESPLTTEARIWAGVLREPETKPVPERDPHLKRVQGFISRGDFEGAFREYQHLLSLSPESPPGDEALLGMGLIHLHYANPKKDFKKALSAFAQLEKVFPRSPLREEARIWTGLIEAIEKARQIDLEIEEKKKKLTR